jgi:proteasome lid subunit RPN8/RPN11
MKASFQVLTIKKADLRSICAHCNQEYPNEACGILAGRDGKAERIYRMANAEPGRDFYVMDPQQQFTVLKEIRQAGLELVGIYHSHTGSHAYPSLTDVSLAYYPEAVYLIVGLMDRNNPQARGYTIVDGRITEVSLNITAEA